MVTSDYDVFISYARKDNETGWVSAIKELIDADARSVQGREYRVFFDTHDIHNLQDWRRRILGALRTSKVLLVCLSPAYFASGPCRWEWDEYAKRQARVMARLGAGEEDDGTIATVFFVSTDDVDAEGIRAWRELAMAIDGIELQPWFDQGPQALLREEVRQRVQSLGTDIWKRVERANQTETAIGNLLQYNPYFVGRTAELGGLHTALRSTDTIGVVTAVHGLGGLGKTELTVQYAHAFRDVYRAGVWQLRAEGHDQMLPLLATLVDEPAFQFTGSEEGAKDPNLRGREVLAELQRRIKTNDAGCLLILDNVTEPELLAEPQTSLLPQSTDLSVVATTRLGDEDFGAQPRLGFVEVGGLQVEDGVTLIRDHQPRRESGLPDFTTPDDEQAARDIVTLLEGFTLAIEQIAIHLGRNPEVSPTWLLDGLRADLRLADQALQPGAAAGIRHQERTLAAVLATTLADLDQPAQTTLRLASMLPPDTVPWPWLRDMVCRLHPEAVAPTPLNPDGAWPRIRRTLEGRRLLTPAGPDLARLHRLHAAHLADEVSEADRAAVDRELIARANAINDGEDVPIWEFGALLDALIKGVPSNPELAAAVNLDNESWTFLERSSEYVGDGRPAHLAYLILPAVQALADAQPGNLPAQRDLSVSLNNVAGMLEDTDPDTALDLYQQARDIAQALADAQPGNLTAQRDLSISLNHVARMLEGTDPDTALTLYQQSRDIAQALADAQPGNLPAQRDLSVSLNNVARMLAGTDPTTALTLYQQSLTIKQSLADAQPGNRTAQRELSISLNNVARMLEDTDPTTALTLYQQSRDIAQSLADAQPGNLPAQRDLSFSLHYVARMLEGTDPDTALTLYQQSLTIKQALADAQPGNLPAQRDLSVSLNNVARMLAGTDPTTALTLYQQSLDIAQALADAQPGNLPAQRELSISLTNVARMLAGTDPDTALTLYQQSRDIAQSLADAQPGNLPAQRDLSITLHYVARMLEGTDPDTALTLYQQSLTIKQALADAQPGNITFARELLQTLHQVAGFSDRVAASSDAVELWQRCAAQFDLCQRNGWLRLDDRMTALGLERHFGAAYSLSFIDLWLSGYDAEEYPVDGSGQLPMSVLDQAGLARLPHDAKSSLLRAFELELQLRIGEELSSGLAPQQLSTFEALQKDQAAALAWLAETVPDFEVMVHEQLNALREILAASAPRILGRFTPTLTQTPTKPPPQQAWVLAESLELDPDHGPDDPETLSGWTQAGELYAAMGKHAEAAEAYKSAARGHKSGNSSAEQSQRLWALALHSLALAHPLPNSPDRRPANESLDQAAAAASSPEALWTSIDQNPAWRGTPRLTAWMLLWLMALDAQDLCESLAGRIRDHSPAAAVAVADGIREIDETHLDEPEMTSSILAFLGG